MHNFVFMLKSFSEDVLYVERLLKSYHSFNKDKIPLYIVVPIKDLNIFSKFKNNSIEIIEEESITPYLVNDNSVWGIRPGYINQQIIKLAFWETGICKNYLCLDSDAEFIRDFFIHDFMYNLETPFSILVEDNELAVDPEYFKEYWISRSKRLEIIKRALGLEDIRTLTCHNMTIFSLKVMRSFNNKFLKMKRYSYIDILKIAPCEFAWYNFWLQKDNAIQVMFREPLFKMFHNKSQHIEYLKKGITIKDIARGYLGIVINSNYSRGYGVISYDSKKPYTTSLMKRIFRKIKRIFYTNIWN